MKIQLTKTPIADLLLIDINYSHDDRGFFIEPWHKKDFARAGLNLEFVQEGHSRSKKDVLRGLHYQDLSAPMGKLARCTYGSVFEVAVDLRMSSATFGRWFGVELSAKKKQLLWVGVGLALGFAVLSDFAEVQYKQTGYYTPASEGTLTWNDLDVGITWPVKKPILSFRDLHGQSLSQYKKNPAFG